MKNVMKKGLLAVLILAMVVCFTACSSEENGTYECELAGKTFSIITLEDGDIKVEFPNSGNVKKGTYEVDGNSIKATYDDGKSDTYTYNAEKGELSLADAMTWTKID